MIPYEDIKAYLYYHQWELDCENDGAIVYKKDGNFITFWCDDKTITQFVLKRTLEKLGKDITDFTRFMEAKHGKPYELKATQESDQIAAQVKVKVKGTPPEIEI